MNISPLAGKKAEQNMLVNIPKLVTAYYTGIPDASFAEQRVAFGASGHRGSSFKNSFNENHILAITQAICLYRTEQKIDGPIYLGFDTHALSAPAFATTMEVLAANKVDVMIAEHDEYTPTPVISHAILKYNQGRKTGLADGIVITPSHNPTDDGGFKYNPPNGGPAGTVVTNWIEKKANELLEEDLRNIKRISFDKAITQEFGEPFYARIEAKATPEQKEKLKKLSAEQIKHKYLAGEKIENILTNAPANNASIGGMKVVTENGWFAARPSGTEDIYKIYAESFSGKDHLKQIIVEAQDIVNGALEIKGQTV